MGPTFSITHTSRHTHRPSSSKAHRDRRGRSERSRRCGRGGKRLWRRGCTALLELARRRPFREGRVRNLTADVFLLGKSEDLRPFFGYQFMWLWIVLMMACCCSKEALALVKLLVPRSHSTSSRRSTRSLFIPDVDGVSREVHILDVAASTKSPNPPLVVLLGTAQTVETWAAHVRDLSKNRRVIIPELRNQGTKTKLLGENGNIPQLSADVHNILGALDLGDRVDLCGFSFGGRVAFAVAATPARVTINKLSLTGVPLKRAPLGSLILDSWCDSLNSQQLRACAWSMCLNGYSPAFLERYAERLPSFVDLIVDSNDVGRLAALMDQSKIDDEDLHSVSSCAARLTCKLQVIGGSLDRIAAIDSVKDLHARMKGSQFTEIAGAGHLVPFESPAVWKKTLLQFLDE